MVSRFIAKRGGWRAGLVRVAAVPFHQRRASGTWDDENMQQHLIRRHALLTLYLQRRRTYGGVCGVRLLEPFRLPPHAALPIVLANLIPQTQAGWRATIIHVR